MAERATVFQATQLGVESTKGTVVPANRRLLATSFKLTPVTPVDGFRPMGSKGFTTVITPKEHTEGEIEGVLAYEDIVYLLSACLESASITTPSGATNTRRWTFKPQNFTIDDYITFTTEFGGGGSGFAERAAYTLINGLTLRWTREETNVSGDILARIMSEGITLTGGPADVPAIPVDPDEISIFLGNALTNEVQQFDLGAASAGTFTISWVDPMSAVTYTTAPIAFNASAAAVQTALETTAGFRVGDVTGGGGPLPGTPVTLTFGGYWAALNVAEITIDSTGLTGATVTIATNTPGGLTKLDRAYESEWAIGNRFTPQMTLDAAQPSFSAEVERSPDLSAQLVVQHDATSAAFMTDLRAKQTKFAKYLMHGGLIELDFRYRIALTFPFKFGSSERDDQDDVWSATYDLIPIYDSTFVGWVEFIVDNTRTAL